MGLVVWGLGWLTDGLIDCLIDQGLFPGTVGLSYLLSHCYSTREVLIIISLTKHLLMHCNQHGLDQWVFWGY